MADTKWHRRDFIRLSAQTAGALTLNPLHGPQLRDESASHASASPGRAFNGPYTGEQLGQISFPMGGIGAGMICLDGAGALSQVSIQNHPDLFNEPCIFAAIAIKGAQPNARVLEGPVPARKVFGLPGSGDGYQGATYGLPRFERASFEARFPFGKVSLSDPAFPLEVELTGWSPFEPGDADNSSLPAAALEYSFVNRSTAMIEAVFSFNAKNFLVTEGCPNAVRPIESGFVLWNGPGHAARWQESAVSATVRSADAKVDHCWLRGAWEPLNYAWKQVVRCVCVEVPPVPEGSPGASLFVPLHLEPGASRLVTLQLAWYCCWTSLRYGSDPPNVPQQKDDCYKPWYAGRWSDIKQATAYWRDNYQELRKKTLRFSNCLYDSTLPPEVIEAVAANLTILKSPTVLRQADGRLWAFEGCNESEGCCPGSCTHVWNYAQAVPYLFPQLERTLRETEFGPSQDETGRQVFRSAMPIRPSIPGEADAADGQLGGIIKIYREWRISGDDAWLRALWPRVKRSLEFSIKTWDPGHVGLLEEPAHNTYDIEFWGPEPLCTGLYLGVLQAAILMSRAMGEDPAMYVQLMEKGKAAMESELFNGEYFQQKIRWERIRNGYLAMMEKSGDFPPELRALIEREGPIYQYGDGCLSDGMLGVWLGAMAGIDHPLDPAKVISHLRAIHKYNFKSDLSQVANGMRPGFAMGHEGGLLLCTWPRGGRPSVPMTFSDEVWTGIEYHVAALMIRVGMVQEGLEIVRTCRQRYDGRVRNPFDEYECGHWYGRAMSSYSLLWALSGARYDAVDKTLYLKPAINGDFRSFFSTATGYGTVGVKDGRPFLEVASGAIPYRRIVYIPSGTQSAIKPSVS
jgi:uncharacterized protein (DUF608 family)